MSNCFNPANILLPNDCIDMEKWSVIACDQFTSQADYWDAVEKHVLMHHQRLMLCFLRYIWEQLRNRRMIAIRQGMVSKMTKKPAGKQNMLQ
mgnify:CR=1 FL=1